MEVSCKTRATPSYHPFSWNFPFLTIYLRGYPFGTIWFMKILRFSNHVIWGIYGIGLHIFFPSNPSRSINI